MSLSVARPVELKSWQAELLLEVKQGLHEGMYSGVPEAIYHEELPGLSNSQLKQLARSPAHYKAYVGSEPREATRALTVGAALHTAVLEPDEFDLRFRERPSGHGASKAYKEAFAEMNAKWPGVRILTAKDIAMVRGMADAVRTHPAAGPLVKAAHTEVSALWVDKDATLQCRGRADIWAPSVNVLGDIKTTTDGRLSMFQRQLYNYRYYSQAAYYLRGWEHLGYEDVAFVFIVIEKEPPYAVAVYELDPSWLMNAWGELSALLELYRTCRELDTWPAYEDHVQPIMMSEWAVQATCASSDRIERSIESLRANATDK